MADRRYHVASISRQFRGPIYRNAHASSSFEHAHWGYKAFSKQIRRCSVDGRKRYENDKCGRKSFGKRSKTAPFSFENGLVWTGPEWTDLKTMFSSVDGENDAIWKRWGHQNRHDQATNDSTVSIQNGSPVPELYFLPAPYGGAQVQPLYGAGRKETSRTGLPKWRTDATISLQFRRPKYWNAYASYASSSLDHAH